ncbi:DUF899 domain-containing protein [Pseudonocardiaceae bacterium YIM PH 21723]|nr:DUF899 domain-containing protein [Pseudonocardiaceae bacterium YIM PH 21723]
MKSTIVSAQDWEKARQELLVKEKEHTRLGDELAASRRRMPWLKVDKQYEFDGPDGKTDLLGLFQGRRQLIVYRAFFEPGVHGWPEQACIGCSLTLDHAPNPVHLNGRDTTLAYVSKAPQQDIARLTAKFDLRTPPWYTILGDFDTDFGVGEWHGTNVFFREGEQVYRTYFVDGRGDEPTVSLFRYLDLTVLGRQEDWEDSPEGWPQDPASSWWHWRDEYPTS